MECLEGKHACCIPCRKKRICLTWRNVYLPLDTRVAYLDTRSVYLTQHVSCMGLICNHLCKTDGQISEHKLWMMVEQNKSNSTEQVFAHL